MKACFLRTVSALLVFVMLSGCIQTITPAQPLYTSNAHSGRGIQLAVQANGLKHVVWINETTYDLHYQRTYYGGSLLHMNFTSSNLGYDYPKVAVTSDGTAVIAWLEYLTSGTDLRACWDTIPPAVNPAAFTLTCHQLNEAGKSADVASLEVAARGNTAYVVYGQVDAANEKSLHYRMVLPASVTGGLVSISNKPNLMPSIAIDASNRLHVAWQEWQILLSEQAASPSLYIFPSSKILYNSTEFVLPNGDMDNYKALLAASGPYSPPKLAIGDAPSTTNDPIFVAVSFHPPAADDEVWILNCTVQNCLGFTGVTVPFSNAYDPWEIINPPEITAMETNAHVIFSANNSLDTSNLGEIYYFSTASPATLSRVTNNATYETHPLITNTGGAVIYGWRTIVSSHVRDIYINKLSGGIQQIYDSSDEYCGLSDTHEYYDLDANSEWIGAVFAEDYNCDGKYDIMMIGNGITAPLPFTVKP